MADRFQIQDGLSQRAREFPELATGFFAVDSTSTESILRLMKEYAREHGNPHFFDDINLSKVVAMMEGEAIRYFDNTSCEFVFIYTGNNKTYLIPCYDITAKSSSKKIAKPKATAHLSP